MKKILVTACALLAYASSLTAQSLYWDSNGSAAGAGATPAGNWTSSSFWNTLSDGTGATGAWTPGATAVFSAGADATGAYQITLDAGTTTFGGLTVEDGTTVTILNPDPATVNFEAQGAAAVDVASGKTLDLKSPVTGAGGLTKTGSGTLNVHSNSTYTGNTILNAGVLTSSNREATFGDPATSVLKLNGGRLHNGQDRQGSGIYFPVKNAVELTATTVISGAGTMDLLLDGNITTSGGTLVISNTLATATTFSLQLNGGGYDFTSPIYMTNNVLGQVRLDLWASNTSPAQIISGVISGSGLVRRSCWAGGEGGISVLAAQNTYTNTTSINGGFLGFGSSSVGVHPNVVSGPVGTNTLSIVADDEIGFLAWGAPRTIGNRIIFGNNAGINTKVLGDHNVTFLGPIDLGTAARTITITNPAVTVHFTGVASNTSALTKAGPGTLAFNNANTRSGTLAVDEGTLSVNNVSGSGTGSGAVTVAAGAAISGTGSVAGAATVAGTVAPGNGAAGTLTFSGGVDLSGANYTWELTANAESAGSFDQIAVTGGSLALDGSSVLTLNFAGTATSPTSGNAFWQAARSWTIVNVNGGSNPGSANFATIQGTNGITAGTFSTSVAGNGSIVLNYAPANVVVPQPTITSITGSGTSKTVTWSSVNGVPYTLQYSTDLGTTNWNDLTPVVATGSSASTTDTNATNAFRFYRVRTP